MNHTISLISTVYNRAPFLGHAIDSVLAQTYGNFELLIWDDGSTDGSLEIAQAYAQQDERIRVFAAPHQGRSAALQAVHAEATGDYLGWIDSDDALSPTALEETVTVLKAKPQVGMVYTDYHVMDAQGHLKQKGVRCQIPYSPERLLQDFMTFHFRLIRRTAFEAVGGIDVSIPVAVDYDLCLRLSEVTKIEHLQRSLYQYRVHAHSISQAEQLRQISWSKESISRALSRRGLAAEWAVEVFVIPSAQGMQGRFSLVRVDKRMVSSLPPWVRWVGRALTMVHLSTTIASNPAWAMPIPNADGTGTQVNVNGNQFDISGGTLSSDGSNLFHSFEQLNLDANQIANFVSQPNIQNILGRINGGNASIIDGLLQVSGGNSNLFLLNPSGILFGNNASLNVPAAFNVSTADGIQFGNGWFSATGTNNYLSLNGAPIGFAFSNAQPSPIINAGNLTVNTGQDLSLLAGSVVSTGQLNAPGGEVTVSSIPGSSYVQLGQPGQLLSLKVLPLSNSATQPNAGSLPTVALPQLLTGIGPVEASGITVGSDGKVRLTGSDVAVNHGDVAVKSATTRTAVLSATHNLSLVESQIQTAHDLKLSALNTVTVRDSAANAVNIQAGNNLTIQGNQGIDIFALNALTSSSAPTFESGGNLDLMSDGLITADANFESQGNIAFLNLDRSSGDFINQGLTTLQSAGVVDLGNYTGVSLKVEANGSIRAGDITITEASSSGISSADPDYFTLKNYPTLILRAGLTEPASIISVGNVTAHSGVVDLSSNGNIFTGNIDVSSIEVGERGGSIQLEAFNVFTGDLNASAPNPVTLIPFGNGFGAGYGFESMDDAGNISVEATNLLRTGTIDAHSKSGNGGDVEIVATDAILGNINTSGSTDPTRTEFFGDGGDFPETFTFSGGNVTITTNEPLQVGTIDADGVVPGTVTINELGFPKPEEPPISDGNGNLATGNPDTPSSDRKGETDLPGLPSTDSREGLDGLPPSNTRGETDGSESSPSDSQGKAVPNLDELDSFTLTDVVISDPTDELLDVPAFSREELERVRTNHLNFLKARRLAGKKMTAQEIASLLDIPLEVAELAVLLPVGEDIKVSNSGDDGLLENRVIHTNSSDITVPGDWKCWIDPICIATAVVGATIVVVWEGGKLVVRVVDKAGKVYVEKSGEAAEAIHRHFFPAKTSKNNAEKHKHGSGKNAQHGKKEVPESLKKQLKKLKDELANLNANQGSKKEKVKIKNKIRNIEREIERIIKGQNHSQKAKGSNGQSKN